MNYAHVFSRKLLPHLSTLVAFEAAARTGSFTHAASELSLTQGAISRQIILLDNLLGVRLFERISKRVILTPAGTFYAERVREALANLATATNETILSHGGQDILRLGILPTLGERWLIPRMSEFFVQYPDVTVNFKTQSLGPFDFAKENLDAAVVFGNRDWPGAKVHNLLADELIPVMAPALMRQLDIRVPSDLRATMLLVHVSQTAAWSHWFTTQGLEPVGSRRTLTFQQFSMVVQAAIAELGVAMVPAKLVTVELLTGVLVRLFEPSAISRPGYYTQLVYPLEKQDYRPLVLFREWLVAKLANERATLKES